MVSWTAFSVLVLAYSIAFQAHMLAILFFILSYVWYLTAIRIGLPQALPSRREVGAGTLRVILMSSLVLLCLWISAETENDVSFLWDDFFFYVGLSIGGFFAGITSRTQHTALVSSLAMSVIVSLMTSLFWAQDIQEFEFAFFWLMVFSMVGMVPARIVRALHKWIAQRGTPPWAP